MYSSQKYSRLRAMQTGVFICWRRHIPCRELVRKEESRFNAFPPCVLVASVSVLL